MEKEITTNEGSINILNPTYEIVEQIRNLLPYGLFEFDKEFNNAKYGIVFRCGADEFTGLKQQSLDYEPSIAKQLFECQYALTMLAYCEYLKHNHKGLYLAMPYLKEKDNTNKHEIGVAHFIFSEESKRELLVDFITEYKKNLPRDFDIPYIGLDVRKRSDLGNIALWFMTLDDKLICLRPNLREEDPVWNMLANQGIKEVYHLPSLPMTISEDQLREAKKIN